jgi:hypothetical protein
MARRRDATASPWRRTALFPRHVEFVGVLQNAQEPLKPIEVSSERHKARVSRWLCAGVSVKYEEVRLVVPEVRAGRPCRM